ncbi:LOW QUALITY PROTEIN: solute carrier family 22 member 3 [Crotalus tigris]|uniref:LOW QUALITY PROTEIN: solute carrier family 22 member 3 n=1 Tax=Crotalus tigris TaxID=88082 RepID=UPI00192F962B|nr:LOW QUALITY PROTEIN: solute carrier family 22 member 3 [Crotalus tigris]
MPSFDEVLKQAGDFGKFQKKVFILLCQTGITFSFLFVGIVFLGRDPEQYSCRIPGVSELKKQCEWTLEEEYNITIQASSLVNSSQCERHDIKWNNTRHNCTYPLAHLTNNFAGESFTTCQDGWLFQKPHSTIASEYDLVCENKWLIDMTQSILNIGFLVGGFVLGYAADRFGRITIYLFSCFGAGLCGLIVAFAPNIIVFSIFRFLQGIFGKGTWMTSFVLVTELVGSDHRRVVGIVIQMFFTLGVVILPGIAYVIPTWQGIQLVTTLPNFLFLLYYWLVPESPRWLITRKKGKKALQIVQSVAKENGQSLPEHFSEIKVSDEEVSNPSLFDLVRTPQMRKFTLILMYAWFTSAVVYQGLVLRLGLIEGNLYLEFFISAVIELPSAFLILATIDRLGRRPLFASGTLVAGAACLITAFLPKDIPWLSTAVAILARLGITITFELVYLVNSELYPTVFRNFGVSLCSGMCDIGGTVAPFLLYRLADIWSELPLIVYCVLSLLCGILVLLLPETKGQPLPETVEDVEKMSSFNGCCEKKKRQNSRKEI